MSDFMSSFVNTTGNKEVKPAIYREMAIDFNTGEPLVVDGEIVELEGKEALRVWIWKALKTECNKYRGYTYRYGQDLWKEIGKVFSRTVKVQMIYADIEDTLKVNPRITKVYNFEVEVLDNGYQVKCTFSVDSIYGTIDFTTIANL